MSISKELKAVLDSLPQKVTKIIKSNTNGNRDQSLQKISQLLKDEVPAYDWVGFYLADPNADRELVLGPYVGEPTDHVRIPFGRGICGQAAETLKTFVVDDVSAEENYLACSVNVKSEVVVPIMKDDTFIGELDIDSHVKSGIGEYDRKILEEICNIVTELF
ncbi:MAG TPA: GAF domain-containing protein [Balneolales bacterium]|nr:GAF domain-containing protein [Balneolales bacterium]